MGSAANSTPIFPFERPLDAILLAAFGLAFFAIATAIRMAAARPEKMSRLAKSNPWFVLFKGREMTDDEVNARLSPLFFKIYGWGGRVGQVIGLMLITTGLVGLIVSIAKQLI
jgi:hypothetical protein